MRVEVVVRGVRMCGCVVIEMVGVGGSRRAQSCVVGRSVGRRGEGFGDGREGPFLGLGKGRRGGGVGGERAREGGSDRGAEGNPRFLIGRARASAMSGRRRVVKDAGSGWRRL